MIPGGLLPVAPRPFEDELLSSWQGRVACRYDLTPDDLAERLGAPPRGRPVAFAGRDFAPADAAVSVWARACRLAARQVREMALSGRRRPVGLYVWGEGRAARAIRRPVCPTCLDEDAEAGRDHHLRRTWAQVEQCLCDRHGRFLSETCAQCSSPLGFRFRTRGGAARLVCIRCQGVVRDVPGKPASDEAQRLFAILSSAFADAADGSPATVGAVLRAARLLWAAPLARGGSRTPFVARIVSGVPGPPRTGAADDRSEPLATASLGWRMATLLGVAQLLDLGGARRDLGAAPFTLDDLAEWTGEDRCAARPPPARPVAGGPAPSRASPRASDDYQRLAQAILASEEWRSARSSSAAARRRTLGRLMNLALVERGGRLEGDDRASRDGVHATGRRPSRNS